MEDVNESSSESNIIVTGIVDYSQSPHQINKKAYRFTMNKVKGTIYQPGIGFNLHSLPIGYYTLAVEYFPPEMVDISITAQATTISINRQNSAQLQYLP